MPYFFQRALTELGSRQKNVTSDERKNRLCGKIPRQVVYIVQAEIHAVQQRLEASYHIKAEVLMIIDQHNGQRFVCGSDAILDTYNKGLLRPTQADHNYDGVTMADPRNSEIPSVEPLDKTPEGVSLDPRLAKVLGHETRDIENNTQSRRRLSYRSSEAVVPVPVQELIVNKPKRHLNDKERSDVPPIQLQSKITFVSDENTVINC